MSNNKQDLIYRLQNASQEDASDMISSLLQEAALKIEEQNLEIDRLDALVDKIVDQGAHSRSWYED